jgi:hypothetical protein
MESVIVREILLCERALNCLLEMIRQLKVILVEL